MTRRRFIWSPADDCLVEVSPDYEQPGRSVPVIGETHYDGMRATDGTPIDTRSKHRAYMKAHGLTTMDDFKGEWAQAAQKRADYYQGKPGAGAVKRGDIARAIAALERRTK